MRLRATTIFGPWYNTPLGDGNKQAPPRPGAGGFNSGMDQPNPVKMSFDQEPTAVLLARVAVEQTEYCRAALG